eukprot:253859_1
MPTLYLFLFLWTVSISTVPTCIKHAESYDWLPQVFWCLREVNQLVISSLSNPRALDRVNATVMNSFYTAVIQKVDTLKKFESLNSLMKLISNQNKHVRVLNHQFWMTVFAVYFSNDNNNISDDREFMQYIGMMGIELSIDVCNVITHGININKQIKQWEETTRFMIDTVMRPRGLYANLRTFECILNGFCHRVNVTIDYNEHLIKTIDYFYGDDMDKQRRFIALMQDYARSNDYKPDVKFFRLHRAWFKYHEQWDLIPAFLHKHQNVFFLT